MKVLKKILALIGMAGVLTVLYFVITRITKSHILPFDKSDVASIVEFVVLCFTLFAVAQLAVTCLIGRGRASGFAFIVVTLVPIGRAVALYILKAGLNTGLIICGALGAVALIVHIVKLASKLRFLGFISGALLLVALIVWAKGQSFNPKFLEIITYIAIAASMVAYAIPVGPRLKGQKKEKKGKAASSKKGAEKPLLKSKAKSKKKANKPKDGEETPKVEQPALAPVVVPEASKVKKEREWTDEHGFVFRNRP